jgi:hypothetical protein
MNQVPYWAPTNGRCHLIQLGNLFPKICVPLDGRTCARVHTLFTCQCHYIGGIILKFKSVKWYSVYTWKYSLVEMHWVLCPAISDICKVGTVIQIQRSVDCWHTLQWIQCLFTQWPYLNNALMKGGTGLKGSAAEHPGFSGFTVLRILWQ